MHQVSDIFDSSFLWQPHLTESVSSFFPSTDAGCESHQRAFRTHPVLVLFQMFLSEFPLYRGVVTEYLFRLTEPFYASEPSLMYVFPIYKKLPSF